MNFKDNLKAIRKSKGITQRELADKSDLSFSMVSKLEIGEQDNPTLDTIKKIAAALDVKVYELMGWDDLDRKYNFNGELANDVELIENIEKEYGDHSGELVRYYSMLDDGDKEKALDYVYYLYQKL